MRVKYSLILMISIICSSPAQSFADCCSWSNENAAKQAFQILLKTDHVLISYEGKYYEPLFINDVQVEKAGGKYWKLFINGKFQDLCYLFVQKGESKTNYKYENLGKITQCGMEPKVLSLSPKKSILDKKVKGFSAWWMTGAIPKGYQKFCSNLGDLTPVNIDLPSKPKTKKDIKIYSLYKAILLVERRCNDNLVKCYDRPTSWISLNGGKSWGNIYFSIDEYRYSKICIYLSAKAPIYIDITTDGPACSPSNLFKSTIDDLVFIGHKCNG